METLNMHAQNPGPVLADLILYLQNYSDNGDIYLNINRSNAKVHQKNIIGINELGLPYFLKRLGIRSLSLDSQCDTSSLSALDAIVFDESISIKHWRDIRTDQLVAALQVLFKHCRTIAFGDWANESDASDLWTGLLSDVIKPLKKKDLDFIFYLGDPGKMLFFQVDEILDIISDFSYTGKVTFFLDEHEAIKLWMVLNGEQGDATSKTYMPDDLKRKYFSIFKTMSIYCLAIYSADDVIIFNEEQQFIMARRVTNNEIELAEDARDNFVAGYSIALLMHLDMLHCMALGLAVFGARGENKINCNQKDLIAYLERWIADLDKSENSPQYQS
jgi:hypothetical protein